MKYLNILLLALLIPCLATAKGKKMSADEYEATIDSLQQVINEYKGKIDAYKEMMGSGATHAIAPGPDNEKVAQLRDSITTLKRELAKVQPQLDAADEMTVRFCYIRLNQDYRKRFIDEAIGLMGDIRNPEIRNGNQDLFELLRNADRYYNEVLNVIFEAQNTNMRNSKAINGPYPKRFREKMKATEYYQKWYAPKKRDSSRRSMVNLDAAIDSYFAELDKPSGPYDMTAVIQAYPKYEGETATAIYAKLPKPAKKPQNQESADEPGMTDQPAANDSNDVPFPPAKEDKTPGYVSPKGSPTNR